MLCLERKNKMIVLLFLYRITEHCCNCERFHALRDPQVVAVFPFAQELGVHLHHAVQAEGGEVQELLRVDHAVLRPGDAGGRVDAPQHALHLKKHGERVSSRLQLCRVFTSMLALRGVFKGIKLNNSNN